MRVANEVESLNGEHVCQLLESLKLVHSSGFVVADVAPRHFLLHRGKTYLIDLGFAVPIGSHFTGACVRRSVDFVLKSFASLFWAVVRVFGAIRLEPTTCERVELFCSSLR